MKTTKRILFILLLVFAPFANTLIAQEEQKRPEYITVTKMHWNMDQENFSMDEWKAVEKEYLDKIVMKNEHIEGASFFLHKFTADNTELLYVQVFNTWNDIDAAAKRNGELAKEAWPDEDARGAFNKKRMAYYALEHSDEIYATLDGAKVLTEMPTKDMTLYIRISHYASPEDGSWKEWSELRNGFVENVINKNEYIKGYYPSEHHYGADRTEFVEAYYVDSVADIDKMFDRTEELRNEAWPDKSTRQELGKNMGKYFTGIHSDFIYTYVSGLSK